MLFRCLEKCTYQSLDRNKHLVVDNRGMKYSIEYGVWDDPLNWVTRLAGNYVKGNFLCRTKVCWMAFLIYGKLKKWVYATDFGA